jgi:hypothetical protein
MSLKLFVGYLLSFIIMTVVVSVMTLAVILAIMASIMFITWSLPVAPINWLIGIRVSTVIGMAVATCFIFSKEGRDVSEDIAKDLWKGLVK